MISVVYLKRVCFAFVDDSNSFEFNRACVNTFFQFERTNTINTLTCTTTHHQRRFNGANHENNAAQPLRSVSPPIAPFSTSVHVTSTITTRKARVTNTPQNTSQHMSPLDCLALFERLYSQ